MSGDAQGWDLAGPVGGAALLGLALAVTALEAVRARLTKWWLDTLAEGRWPHGTRWATRLRGVVPLEAGAVGEAAMKAYDQGALDAATRLLAALPVETLRSSAAWNKALCVLVASGRYAEALAEPHLQLPVELEGLEAVMRINEAEALACQGLLEDSLEHVSSLEASPYASFGLVRGGLASHRGWVLAVLGRPVEARAAWATAQVEDLPRDYQSEYHFAGAFIALAEGNLAEARQHVARGQAVAVRASTSRNALFLLARLEALAGNHEEALRLYAEGAAHRFTGQGGDALLAWGELLRERGDDAGARRAWTLATERGPESPAAATARARLLAPPRS